jgi:cation diffusion facilitator CzcD-associated flavoprotein CzcO
VADGPLIRIEDERPPPNISDLDILASRTLADPPLTIPENLPAHTVKCTQPRFTESSIYPYLETNVDHSTMSFTQEAISTNISDWSRAMYGPSTPFRPWQVIREYVQNLVNGYRDLVAYNTTVERAVKTANNEWKLTLRKEGEKMDYWWEESFDAVVVASGRYSVPYVPRIDGLAQFAAQRPGSVIHSKHFRGRDAFRGAVSLVTP